MLPIYYAAYRVRTESIKQAVFEVSGQCPPVAVNIVCLLIINANDHGLDDRGRVNNGGRGTGPLRSIMRRMWND
jgi:hypothetical protein